MPLYKYKARNSRGELLSAVIEAPDDMSVAASLRLMGYSIVSIEREPEFKTRFFDFLERIKKSHRQELIFFCRQLATLFKSGIPISAALSSITEQAKSKVLKGAINAVLKDIQAGVSFSDALAKYPEVFSEIFVSMVKVGEAAGILGDVLERLAQLEARELEVKTRVRSAMVYPVILVVVAVIIVNFLLINIIPRFISVFEAYEVRLPLATRILLGISFLARLFLLPVLVAAVVFIYWFRGYLKTENGRYNIDAYLLRLPFFGQLYLKVAVARFSHTLATLLKSGVPLLEALYVTQRAIGNSVIARIIDNIRSAVSAGLALAEPLKASGVFPSSVVQMVALGEKSGRLAEMLSEVASFYDREVEFTMKNITTALEPLLLLAMGGMVAFIALSVLLPIFNLIKVFR